MTELNCVTLVVCLPEIEHSDAAVSPDAGEHVPPAPRLAERDVVHLLVVSDELGLDVSGHHVDSAEHLASLQAPHGAGGVYRGGPQQVRVNLVPVKRGQRGTGKIKT